MLSLLVLLLLQGKKKKGKKAGCGTGTAEQQVGQLCGSTSHTNGIMGLSRNGIISLYRAPRRPLPLKLCSLHFIVVIIIIILREVGGTYGAVIIIMLPF